MIIRLRLRFKALHQKDKFVCNIYKRLARSINTKVRALVKGVRAVRLRKKNRMDVHQPALNDLVEHDEDNPSSTELRIESEESTRVDCLTTSEHNRYLPTSEQSEKRAEFYQPDLVKRGEESLNSFEASVGVETTESRAGQIFTENKRYLPASEQARENEDFCDIYRCESDPSVSSGTSAMTIPSRQYSYENHFYPTASESSVEFDEWSNALSTTPSSIADENQESRDYRSASEKSEVNENDNGDDASVSSESSGMTIPLRRSEMFDPENKRFHPAYSGRKYLTSGGQETVARAEYSYSKRYYRTASETSVEHDERRNGSEYCAGERTQTPDPSTE
uniref:Uncharacterized protein n=1 Tax=Sipha flava TaxID=143950 RepID=A0A2S2QYX6_9HEMI